MEREPEREATTSPSRACADEETNPRWQWAPVTGVSRSFHGSGRDGTGLAVIHCLVNGFNSNCFFWSRSERGSLRPVCSGSAVWKGVCVSVVGGEWLGLQLLLEGGTQQLSLKGVVTLFLPWTRKNQD